MSQFDTLLAWFVVFAHSVGGVSLALGFVTRWAAAINILVLAGAVSVQIMKLPGASVLGTNHDFQFAMLVLVTLIVFFWQGAGRLSFDRMMDQSEA